MIVYGLTGGIGSGKSTVANMFRRRSVDVFDADALGHEILASDSPQARQIQERFPDCRGPEGIDRKRLGARVFADPEQRRWLEQLLHPAIRQALMERVGQLKCSRFPFCLVEGAVLIESRTSFDLAGLIVVTAPEPLRVERLMRRDGSSAGEIQARMQAQLPEPAKVRQADYVIENTDSIEQTRLQVESVLQRLIEANGGVP